jgi:spermidine/putrescine transport system permease protein
MTRARSIAFLAPGLTWLALFLLLPLLVLVLNAALPQGLAGGFADGFTAAQFARLLEPATLALLADSARLAGLATLIALLAGGPAAWAIARAPRRRQGWLLLLVLLPFFTSLLVRVHAGVVLLGEDGLLAAGLAAAEIAAPPGGLLGREGAVLLGLVYSYLPFAVLVLYAWLRLLDPELLEASAELGASPGHTLLRIVLPLMLPGIAAAAFFVFVLSFASYIAPALLGGADVPLLGPLLYEQFQGTGDRSFGAALASLLVVLMLLLLLLQSWLAGRLQGGRAVG